MRRDTLKTARFANRALATLVFAALMLTVAQPASAASPLATSSSKQIVFLMGDSALKFVSVSISGYNQGNQWTTWTKQDGGGFKAAYTKNWWWSENFVQISFVIQDAAGKQTQKSCAFDRLAQPANSPRVEIVYYSYQGCVGGEAGSIADPVKDAIRPLRDAFRTIGYYLPENKFDFFMTVLNNEMNATSCVLGVAALIPGGGVSAVWFGPSVFMSACPKTGNMIYQIFASR
jgi:hypothetical protein